MPSNTDIETKGCKSATINIEDTSEDKKKTSSAASEAEQGEHYKISTDCKFNETYKAATAPKVSKCGEAKAKQNECYERKASPPADGKGDEEQNTKTSPEAGKVAKLDNEASPEDGKGREQDSKDSLEADKGRKQDTKDSPENGNGGTINAYASPENGKVKKQDTETPTNHNDMNIKAPSDTEEEEYCTYGYDSEEEETTRLFEEPYNDSHFVDEREEREEKPLDITGMIRLQAQTGTAVPASAQVLMSESGVMRDMLTILDIDPEKASGVIIPVDFSKMAVVGCVEWMEHYAVERKEQAEDHAGLREMLYQEKQEILSRFAKWKKEREQQAEQGTEHQTPYPATPMGLPQHPSEMYKLNSYIQVGKIEITPYDILDDEAKGGMENFHILERLESYRVEGEDPGRRLRRARRVSETRSRILKCGQTALPRWESNFEKKFWFEYGEDALDVLFAADYFDIQELTESFATHVGILSHEAHTMRLRKKTKDGEYDRILRAIKEICRTA